MAGIVKSVEFVEVNTTGTSISHELTKDQDYTNCVPFLSVHGDQDYPDTKTWDCSFSGTTSSGFVNFYRYNGRSTEGYVKCFVVEFDPDEVYVEHGTFDVTSSTTDSVTTTSGFNPERTAITHNWWSSNANTGNWPQHLCRARVTGSGTLDFYRTGVTDALEGHWFLFEAKNDQFIVEHHDYSGAFTTAYETLTRSYDPLKTFMVTSVAGGYVTTSNYSDRALIFTRLENRDTVRIGRAYSTGTSYVAAQIIEFQDTNIHIPHQNMHALTAVSTSYTWSGTGNSTIPVDQDYSMVINTASYFDWGSATSQSTFIDGQASSVKFTDDYTIQMYKNSQSTTTYPSVFVVDWQGYTVSGTTNPAPMDPALSPVKSVQNTRIYADGLQGLAYLEKGQNIDNCVVFASYYCDANDNAPNSHMHDVFLSDTKAIVTRRTSESSLGVTDVSVVEFYPDQVRVQSGTFSSIPATTEVNVPLEHSIDTTKAFMLASWSSNTTTINWPYHNLRVRLVDEDNVGFFCEQGLYNHATWYVAEDITNDNSCFDVHHWIDSSAGDVLHLTDDSYFSYNNTFLITSVAGGYNAANYSSRSCIRSYYDYPTAPQRVDVVDATTTKYYAGQVVRFRRDGRFRTVSSAPELSGLTLDVTMPTTWSGATDITINNNNLLSVGSISSTSQSYNAAVFNSGLITDYDNLTVQHERSYAPTPVYCGYTFINWQGSEEYTPIPVTPTRSLIQSVNKFSYTGDETKVTWYFDKDQNASQCVPLATWNINGTTLAPEEGQRLFSLESAFGKPYALYMDRGSGTKNVLDTTVVYSVEFDEEQVKIQSGTYCVTSADFTVDIDTVDLDKAFLVFYSNVDGNQVWDAVNLSGVFEDTSTLRFRRTNNTGVVFVSWYVVECLQDQWKVQHLYSDPNSAATSYYNTLNHAVNSKKFWIFNSYAGGYAATTYPGRNSLRTIVRMDDLVEINREDGTNNINYFSSQVVEFNNTSDIRILYNQPYTTAATATVDTFTADPVLSEKRTVVFNPTANNTSRCNATSHSYGAGSSFLLQELIDFDINDPKVELTKADGALIARTCTCVTEFPDYKKYYMEGYVTERNNPVPREVRAYKASTGELVDTTTSVSGTGYFFVETSYSGAHYVVCLDDDAGFNYNHLIYGRIYPTVISGSFAYNEGLVTASGLQIGVPLGRQ